MSPSFLQLRQGQSSNVTVMFTKYFFNGDKLGHYFLYTSNNERGVRVNAWKTQLRANDTTPLTVSAAQNADLGRHHIDVIVQNREGDNVQTRLTVDVVK